MGNCFRVSHCFFFFFFLFFDFLIFLFLNVKNGATPLFIAAQEGHEQIVEILLEKGKANVDLTNEVILLIVFFFFFFFFFFSLSHFSIFFIKRTEQLLFILLLLMDMNKLFNFYWKKEQTLIMQNRF